MDNRRWRWEEYEEKTGKTLEKGAPIKKGDCLGKVTYTLNNEQLLEVNLLAESDIEKNTVWNLTTSLYQRWFNMLR